jgi:endonuclease YncB( thermonuclease family)
VRVVDGDTFIADMERGYPRKIMRNIGIRIAGIDAPELRDKRPEIKKLAYSAKKFARERLSSAKNIKLKNLKKGKYFRIVADVYVDGKSLSKELLAKGYAKPYNGGKKPEFSDKCE